jgi:hypothetical protein
MGNGIIPDAKGVAEVKLKKEHLLIRIPGENYDRKCLYKDSLMYVAYCLNREYVHLPGINDGAIKVSSLSNDVLRAKVFMYHIDTNKTFTAIIAGSGFTLWYANEKENKK